MDLEFLRNKRVVVLGIGNKLRGDDSVGSLIAEELKSTRENVLVLDCEDVPENFKQKIIDFKPDFIVMVDSVDMKKEPGNFEIFEITAQSSLGTTSTHNISLQVLANSFKTETNAKVFLLGIQPKNLEFDSGLSQKVLESKNKISGELKTIL